jgi:hypothetical protein
MAHDQLSQDFGVVKSFTIQRRSAGELNFCKMSSYTLLYGSARYNAPHWTNP